MATKKKPAAPVKRKPFSPLKRTEKQKREEFNRRRREKRAAQKTEAETPPAFTVKLRKKQTPTLRLGLRSPQALTGIALADVKEISDIDTKSKEGRLFIAALAILTTSKSVHLAGKDCPGVKMTPFQVLDKVKALAEDIYKDAPPPLTNVLTVNASRSVFDRIESGDYDRALVVDNEGNIFGVPTPDGKLHGFKFTPNYDLRIVNPATGEEKSPIDFASDFCRGLNLYPAGKQNDILREVVSTIKNRNQVTIESWKKSVWSAKRDAEIAEESFSTVKSQAKAQDLILSGSYDALRLEGSEED